jgi:hypothetical protein
MRNINPDNIYSAFDPFDRYYSLTDLNLVWREACVNSKTAIDFIQSLRFTLLND